MDTDKDATSSAQSAADVSEATSRQPTSDNQPPPLQQEQANTTEHTNDGSDVEQDASELGQGQEQRSKGFFRSMLSFHNIKSASSRAYEASVSATKKLGSATATLGASSRRIASKFTHKAVSKLGSRPEEFEMDVSDAAGLDLMLWTEKQWQQLHTDAAANRDRARRAEHEIGHVQQRASACSTSVDALVMSLKDVQSLTTALLATQTLVADITHELHSVDDLLNQYERLRHEYVLHQLQTQQQSRMSKYRQRQQALLDETKRRIRTDAEERARFVEAQKNVETFERRRMYRQLFEEQLEYFRQHRQIPTVTSIADVERASLEDDLQLEDRTDLEAFLADTQAEDAGDATSKAGHTADEDADMPVIEVLAVDEEPTPEDLVSEA